MVAAALALACPLPPSLGDVTWLVEPELARLSADVAKCMPLNNPSLLSPSAETCASADVVVAVEVLTSKEAGKGSGASFSAAGSFPGGMKDAPAAADGVTDAPAAPVVAHNAFSPTPCWTPSAAAAAAAAVAPAALLVRANASVPASSNELGGSLVAATD